MSTPILPGFDDLTQIGKGGFSRVYRGTQRKLSRQVAIKVLNFGLAEEADRASFERETQLMGRVSAHPNIVTVYDTAFTDSGQPCIVMELYSGGSLAELIGAHGHLAPAEVLEVGVAIAGALDTSHAGGVLHCDLKPQNILISDYGQPALTDFGISTFAEERSRTGSGAGFTLHYAAPEVIEGASSTTASDVYSLAATLYTALAGRRPFASTGEKQTAGEIARRVLLEEPASLAQVGVPTEIDELVRRAMSKQPSDRPSTAAAFAQQLYEAGQSLGYGTAPPSTTQRPPLPGVLITPQQSRDDDTTIAPARGNGIVVAPLASPAGVADSTALRRDPHVVVEHEQVELQSTSRSRQRSLLAAALAGVSLIAVVGALWLGTTRGDNNEPVDEPEQTRVPALAVDPVTEPDTPTGVTLTRTGAGTVRVGWQSDEQDDVRFEVRRTDVPGADVIKTTEQFAVLENIGDDELPCVTILALRANLIAQTDDVCLDPPVTENDS